jgi:hypothetical protein
VNVWNKLAASVRNSVLSVIVVTLTEAPESDFCEPVSAFEVVDLLTLELENTLEVVELLPGPEPGACWMSFPCSAMIAGPNFAKLLRSFGKIWLRTKSLTGCLLLSSEYTSISN